MDVPSATTLSATGCMPDTPDRTSFGVVQPGSGIVTGLDCDVSFGSSNDSSTLRAYQSDGRGSAMSTPPTSMTGSGSSSGFRTMSVDMANGSIGWAATSGNSGTNRIWKTTDGGASWSLVADADINADPGGVHAVSATVAWAVGNNVNNVFRTTDGTDWTNVTGDLPATAKLNVIAATSSTTAIAAGYVTVASVNYAAAWRTTTGGTSWTQVHLTGDANTEAVGIATFAAGHSWLAQTNGSTLYSPTGTSGSFSVNSSTGSITAFAAASADKVVVVSGSGTITYTTNGTNATPTWTSRASAERFAMNAIEWTADDQIWMVGAKGTVQRSTDGTFSTWTTVDQRHEPSELRGISSPAAGHVVIAGSGRSILSTTDTGSTWAVWRHASGGTNFSAIDATAPSRMWRVAHRGIVETSVDGGVTWAAQASPTTTGLWDVAALDRQTAIAVGGNGTIIRTGDGGTTWTTAPSGVTSRLQRVTFSTDGTTAFASGVGGVLLRSNDRGASWSPISTGVTSTIWTVAAWSADSLVIGTADIIVRTTTNGGGTWTTRASGASESILDGVVVPATSTVVLLYDDNVAVSTDAGATWNNHEMPDSGQVLDLDLAAPSTLWTAGHYARTQRSTDLGATWSSKFSGTNTVLTSSGVVAMGADAAVTVSESDRRDYTVEGTTVPDYTGTQWGAGAGMFAICLRSAPGATSTWPTTGSCPQADGTNWRAVPTSPASATARVGDLAAAGTATASFRFGLYVAPAQPPGTYRAPVSFEVVAPAA